MNAEQAKALINGFLAFLRQRFSGNFAVALALQLVEAAADGLIDAYLASPAAPK